MTERFSNTDNEAGKGRSAVFSPEFVAAIKAAADFDWRILGIGKSIQAALDMSWAQNLPRLVFNPEIKIGFQNAFSALGKYFANSSKAKKVLEAGWVPYAGMPFERLKTEASTEEADAFARKVIGDDWDQVRHCLLKTVRDSEVDQEAIDTFTEALDAYEHGYYRSVVRVLFPEVERVARETVYGGSRNDRPPKGKPERRRLNTGMHGLREALMEELPAGLAIHADLGFCLAEKMNEHLYQFVGPDEASLQKFRLDPVPNRHASQHGYVTYSSSQNAFNALSMAAFMFHCTMNMHRYFIREAAEAA